MVKFSKEFESQMIPEWKEALVDYRQLKKYVKKVMLARKPKETHEVTQDSGISIFDPNRAFAGRVSARPCNGDEHKEEIIQVKNKGGQDDQYETELIQFFSEEDEVKMFIERLDEELNKVNKFYESKEGECIERGEVLNKQLEKLVDVKQVLSDRRRGNYPFSRSNSDSPPSSNPPSAQNSDYSETPSELSDNPTESAQTDEVIAEPERNGVRRIDIPATTPTQAITAVTSMSWEDLVNNPKKIRCAEKMIRSAFVELYRGLGLLKTYRSLNMVAFKKILKKFDNVSNQQASAAYLRTVNISYFVCSDKVPCHCRVIRLMDEVESIFTKHFANNNRKKAMKFLRPQQNKDSHMPGSDSSYVETVDTMFSMFALLSLHLFMYGCNLFMWKSTRINYNFIFEFSPNTSLKYRDAFLICTSIMTAVVGAMVIHLVLTANNFSPHQVNAIPGILLLLFVTLLICPLNIFYRPTRHRFLRAIRNIVFSPFYKVLMVDFFMADQLTSQIPLLRHMQSTACYFLAGSFGTHRYENCHSGKTYRELVYVISFLPYYWRVLQCARKWFDEGDVNHLANLGKYASSMVAAGARLTLTRQPTAFWMLIAVATSVIATVYQLYWDFVKDWGFFNPKSKNPFLRDDLILKNKSIYYVSIVLNLVLRVAWVEAVIKFNVPTVESRLLHFSMASLEVIRRGHWNFYRLENEHLNNCGKFRAVKAVPLPFCETDLDG
ncbi:EXS, C-terminal [Dillenia turbinata]|uniref:EXS, C-terminal n=1 Tax=Dillenia turbinata TaxID=194707 RepID=A0AAN8UHI9_9MAGN